MNSIPMVPILLACLVFILNFLLSRNSKGSWSELTEHYVAVSSPSGEEFELQSGKIGKTNYRNCLTINVTQQGFYISRLFTSFLGKSTLFIPWSEVMNAKKSRFLWIESIDFEIGSPPVATMSLPLRIFKSNKSCGIV